MTVNYKIEGMTCNGCVAGVKKKLEALDAIKVAEVSLENKEASLELAAPVSLNDLREVLGAKYTIEETVPLQKDPIVAVEEEGAGLKDLYPLFLVFAFLIGGVLLRQVYLGTWDVLSMMTNFMGGFFVVFSFFKLLDLAGFASAFRMYDPIAGSWSGYAYIYPFIELGLGLGFLCYDKLSTSFGFQLKWLAMLTLVIVGIGTIGVARTVLNKQKILYICSPLEIAGFFMVNF